LECDALLRKAHAERTELVQTLGKRAELKPEFADLSEIQALQVQNRLKERHIRSENCLSFQSYHRQDA
jgi:hypothetical protein